MPPIKKISDQPNLVLAREFPHASFPFEHFNPVQSRLFEIYDQDVNIVVAASTSAGKTICAEMMLSHEVRVRGGKGMYLSPLKALSQEKIDDWTKENHHFHGLNMSICTGDYRLTSERKEELEASNIIVMTSEMLNSRARNDKSENNEWLKQLGTVVVDECFDENTLVLTENGYLPIGKIISEGIQVRVASLNHKNGVIEYKRIIGRKKQELFRKWYAIHYNGGYILVTENQLVWVCNKGYVEAKDIQKGDLLYAATQNKKSYRTYRDREKSNIRNTVRRWKHFFVWGKQQISAIKNQSIECPEGTCRVEVQRVEAIGWNPTYYEGKRRVGQQYLHLFNAFVSRTEGNISGCGNQWGQDCESGMVEQYHTPNSPCCMVYGRWKPKSFTNDDAHRVFLQIRGRIIGELADGPLAHSRRLSLPIEGQVLDTEISFRGQRRVSMSCGTVFNSQHVLQSHSQNGGDLLPNVWTEVFDEKATSNGISPSFIMWGQRMPSSMGQNGEQNFCVEKKPSICCDLEIEDNHNFFVKQPGSDFPVLAHNCHLLTVPGRGDKLEAGLMKLTEINPNVRLVLLSATMPNVDEISEWVSYSLTGRETYLLESSYRPCPLTVYYERYYEGGNYDSTELQKMRTAISLLESHPDDKFLIFTHTKRTGEMLKREIQFLGEQCEFHNADLDAKRRVDLEYRFRNDPEFRCIIATSTLAYGLNMPARRVIVMGVHRGLEEVATYDITQMVGRAGRVGLDPRGDAYVLLPEKTFDHHIKRLNKPQQIKSQMLEHVGNHYKILAFHLVSEIHHGNILTVEDIHRWYERSLASWQANELEEGIVDSTLQLLKNCGAIWQEADGTFTVTNVGKVASMFYFSPFDVYDLKKNFTTIFEANKEEDDFSVALALGNLDTHRFGIVSRVEREAMGNFIMRAAKRIPGVNEAAVKAAFAYYQLLNGTTDVAFSGMMRNLQYDFPRVMEVVGALDQMGGKWKKKKWLKSLGMRVKYGVKSELVPLCEIPNVGKVRAEKLWAAGLHTVAGLKANPDRAAKVLGMSLEKITQMLKTV